MFSFMNMVNTIFTRLIRPIASKIAWIGGATAGITVVFSAIGFLVTRAHHELLGITGLVPNPPETWTIEGARFIYNSLLYMFGGLWTNWWIRLLILVSALLIALAAHSQSLTRIRKFTKYSVVRALIVVLTFVTLIGAIMGFLKDEQISYLLVSSSSPSIEQAIQIRQDESGIQQLRLQYAFLASIVMSLFVWITLLPHFFQTESEKQETSEQRSVVLTNTSLWYIGVWFLFLIPLFLLPMEYGKMVKSNRFFKVHLLLSDKSDKTAGVPRIGWLLHKDQKEMVLYDSTSSREPIQIVKRDKFAGINILTYASIFSDSMLSSPPTFPYKKTSLGQAVINMGKMLQELPETIAAGILSIERGELRLHTLIFINANGELIDIRTPLQEDEKGSVQSPIWLPNEQILFVEIRDNNSFLKTVPAMSDQAPQDFGNISTNGWSPHITPDAKSVIFCQGTKIIKANLKGTERTTLIERDYLEKICGVFPDDSGKGYHIVFSELSKDSQKSLWVLNVQGTDVSFSPISYDDHWLWLTRITFHKGRMLHEQQDEVQGQKIWNIYLSDSPQEEGRKISSDDHNDRYPAWSLDGTKIVFVSD